MAGRRTSQIDRRGRGATESYYVDTHELRTLVERLRSVEDKKLKAALRKTLKQAADLAVEGVKEAVQDGVPPKVDGRSRIQRLRRRQLSTRLRSTGLRADIARVTRASLTKGTARNGAQVSVVANDARLRPEHRGMVKAYNSRVFRHPVFADAVNGDRDSRTKGFRALKELRRSQGRSELKSWKWVEQRGQANYFGRGVYGKRIEMMRRLQAAMDDVARQITG